MARAFDALVWATAPQYLEVQSTPVTSAPITLAGWANPASFAGFPETVVIGIFGSNNPRNQMCIQVTNEGIRARAYADLSGLGDANMGSPLTLGTWHHVAGVFASTTSRTPYRDGVAGTENTTEVVQTGINRISVGRNGDTNPDSYAWGWLAEPAMWDVALTAQEIAVLAAGAYPPEVRPANLVFYSPIYGFDSPEPDLSDGNRDLTVMGAPPYAAHPTIKGPPVGWPASGHLGFAPFNRTPMPMIAGPREDRIMSMQGRQKG